MGTTWEKSLIGTLSAASPHHPGLWDSVQWLCSRRSFAEVLLAGEQWMDWSGREVLLLPLSHPPWCQLPHKLTVGTAFLGSHLPSCCGPSTAALGDTEASVRCHKEERWNWRWWAFVGAFHQPAHGWRLLPKASLQCDYCLCCFHGKIRKKKKKRILAKAVGQLGSVYPNHWWRM